MDREELRGAQAPLKERYRADPGAAMVTLEASGTLGEGVSCSVDTGRAIAEAGLHPASGGDGTLLCSGDMLLEALVACAGVSLRAAAAVLEIPIKSVAISAEGDVDLRGTLGIAEGVPVGFKEIRLSFAIETDAPQARLDQLLELTDRYCVIFQTIQSTPKTSVTISRHGR